MDDVRFTVFLGDRVTGHIDVDRGRMSFGYRDSVGEDASPISLSLPLRKEPYGDGEARPYFENLLPESEFRHFMARHAGLADRNTSGILGAIGGECPGAVSIWPGELDTWPPGSYEATTVAHLGKLFNASDDTALMDEQRKGRISLPGALPKLTLRLDDGDWRLARAGAATTHILKRTSLGFAYLVENEYFCMRLADRCGLNVPHVFMLDVGIPLLAIERFDRIRENDNIARVHQEDFCQATACLPAAKYEADGGPGFATAIRLLRGHSALPLADVAAFVRWGIFNYVIGNEDAHAKNVALLYGDEGVRLAPFYDLVSTEVYKGLQRKSAMAIGGERRFAYVRARQWSRMANEVGLTIRGMKRLLRETEEAVSSVLDATHDEAVSQSNDIPIHLLIRHLVEARVTAIRDQLANWD